MTSPLHRKRRSGVRTGATPEGVDTQHHDCDLTTLETTIIRLVVVSTMYLFAEGLARALEADPRFRAEPAKVWTDRGLVSFGEPSPHVVLLDVSSTDDEVVHRLLSDGATPVIGLGIRGAETEVVGWAERGLAGLVTRDASLDELKHAIISVAEHDAHCSPCLVAPLLRRIQTSTPAPVGRAEVLRLTAREREILDLLALGLSNKEIAMRLGVRLSTIKNHVHNLMCKLDVTTRAGAVGRLNRI